MFYVIFWARGIPSFFNVFVMIVQLSVSQLFVGSCAKSIYFSGRNIFFEFFA